MNIQAVKKQFDLQIKNFSKKKDLFCRSPGKDFTRKRKQSFEQTVRSILSLEGGTLTNEILPVFLSLFAGMSLLLY